MKATLKDCKKTFSNSYQVYEKSYAEFRQVWEYYHNRQYDFIQKLQFSNREQPPETYNVIKLFSRLLLGYYSTVVNTVKILPRNPKNTISATVLNDVVNFVFETNRFDIEGEKIKLLGMLSGVFCSYVDIEQTDKKDDFGRTINQCKLYAVPTLELVLDPESVEEDYSDARYIHRFRWLTKEKMQAIFGKSTTESRPSDNFSFLGLSFSSFTSSTFHNSTDPYGDNYSFTGDYRREDKWLVVHTVLVDDSSRVWSIYWTEKKILSKTEVTNKSIRFPYRVLKLNDSYKHEFYGIFREVLASQDAINQSLAQIQVLANSNKVLVGEDAVEDIEEFRDEIQKINGVIQVKSLDLVREDKFSIDIEQQYRLVDHCFDRIKKVLGINDSFLGLAYASDSGRKVKIQQNASVLSLRYLTLRIESFYRYLAKDVASLVQQYYNAHQYIRILDNATGIRWAELNKPMVKFSGQYAQNGFPEYVPILVNDLDPETGEFVEDEEGNVLVSPVSDTDTYVKDLDYDITIESSVYNDNNERAQLMLESVLSGKIGQYLAEVNPPAFLKVSSLAIKAMGTKYTPEISDILEQTAEGIQNLPQQNTPPQPGNKDPRSQELKLPQNTNE